MKKLLDVMAAICLVFNVDWEKDFGDDEYVLAVRKQEALDSGRIRVLPAAAPSKAG